MQAYSPARYPVSAFHRPPDGERVFLLPGYSASCLFRLRVFLPDGYVPEELEQAYPLKTKALVLTSPSNPTGMVTSRKDLEMVADFAVRQDIFVISDEIYEKLIFRYTVLRAFQRGQSRLLRDGVRV